MSDPTRPFTDSEAEALLAFGDRIARGQTATPENELEAVALRVHRALRLPAPRQTAMPRALKTAVWEEIMHSSTAAAMPRPGTPAMRPANWRPATPSHRAWMVAANLGLVLVLLLAGFGAWRMMGDGGSPGTTGNPGVALQAGTPEAAAVTPAVTDAPAAGCALDQDIPIIPQVAPDQELPQMTYLAIRQYDRMALDNPIGDLVIGCAGVEPDVLAKNVYSAGPGPWPGTVQVTNMTSQDASAPMPTMYVKISTWDRVAFAPGDAGPAPMSVSGSPWVIGTSSDGSGRTIVADLRTMETRLLQDVFGIDVPADALIAFSSPADDGSVLVGFRQPYGGDAYAGTVLTDLDAPGDLLRLGASFDDTAWITLPDSLAGVSAVSLSPNGALALVTVKGEAGMLAGSYRFALLDRSTGALVTQSADITGSGEPLALWVGDGNTVVYLAGSTVQTLSAQGETVAFEADGIVGALSATWDPNVVTVATTIDRSSNAAGEQTGQDAVYAVNISTNESREFLGLDASYNASWLTDTGALVMYQPSAEIVETTTYQVYDPVTGDLIGTIDDAPSVQAFERMQPVLGKNSVAFSANGAVEVIALGTAQVYAFTVEGERLQMRRIASPEGLFAETFLTADIVVSPDGGQLSLFGQENEGRDRYVISLADQNAEWTRIENTVIANGGELIVFAASSAD